MNDLELAEEIEKRRGGSIEYLGKLLWSNSTRIIAALRRGAERKPSDDLDEPYFYLRGYRKRWRSFSHFNGNVISYDDVVEWSGIDSDREVIRERIYTITYAMPHGSKRRDGTLVQGESVEFESGMVFNISRTEKA